MHINTYTNTFSCFMGAFHRRKDFILYKLYNIFYPQTLKLVFSNNIT